MGWFILGLFIGGPIGFMAAALLIVASDSDDREGRGP